MCEARSREEASDSKLNDWILSDTNDIYIWPDVSNLDMLNRTLYRVSKNVLYIEAFQLGLPGSQSI